MLTFSSIDPSTGEKVWTGPAASREDVATAVARARAASVGWARKTLAEREAVMRSFASVLEARKLELAAAISKEVGKPAWEALTEVQSMIGKVDLSIKAYTQRCAEFKGGPAITRFRPHGVVAVFGPFNFPGHLPNGHIVPALLAGNTVVFKPSEYAPLVAERTAAAWKEAGLPSGALEVVQGSRETGGALVDHPGIDGLFFTGSSRAGIWLAERFAHTPERILALEMGGNNPLVVHEAADQEAAALLTIQSGYLTAGQRCTCARRLIVPEGRNGNRFLATLETLLSRVIVGAPADRPEPFMGPVISVATAGHLLAAQRDLVAQGARSLVELRPLKEGTGLLSPGLIDVTRVPKRSDEELFGPLLQVIRVPDFAAAIQEANATRYGLAAGLISDNPHLYQQFFDAVRAGIVNWNQQLTGASGGAPFGGIGRSGNHRPSAFFAADYCSYPVASIEVPELKRPANLPPGLRPA